jgi:hypothetical protein
MYCAGRSALFFFLCAFPMMGQETRGMIFGRVLDPKAAAVVGAAVSVVNTGTGTVSNLITNYVGYYEAPLLLPGNYTVSVEAAGFKKAARSGIELTVAARLQVDMDLQLGSVSEAVTVTAEAPLLETGSVSTGRTINQRAIRELPMMGGQPTLLVQMTPGMFHTGAVTYTVPGFNIANSRYFTALNVGGNDWTVDGAPNNANFRRVGNVPHADTVQEFRVETSNFDASVGHATGASISMMTKAGTNRYHGSVTNMHSQETWNGSSLFRRQLYYRSIAQANAAGDAALERSIRDAGLQPPGYTNSFTATVGGPILKNKLFFFFSFWNMIDRKNTPPGSEFYTVPTLANRDGDFSQLLQVNSTLYQIYDPLTIARDPARPNNFIRQPFAGNILPKTRIINPTYAAYSGFFPIPNNDPTRPTDEPANNLNTANGPRIIDHIDLANRIDYNLSPKHRFFGRWTYSDFLEDEDDWTFSTVRGLQSADLSRRTRGGTIDWVYAHSAATLFNFTLSANEFNDANLAKKASEYKPSDVGFPTYIDEKAGEQHVLPQMSFAGYAGFTRGAYPARNFYRTAAIRSDLSHVRGKHSLRGGFSTRQYMRTNHLGGITSGQFAFTNFYTRRNDDTLTPAGNLGHSWASFMMGLPSTSRIDTNDTFALHNPACGFFVQDSWRATPKLTINFGLRIEYENGVTERYNRQLTYFDPGAALPISQIAEAAYAARPIPEVPASTFKVLGGSVYAGQGGADRRRWGGETMFMPRVAVAYQIDRSTVLRGGYGSFYDTLNPNNINSDQFGYSRSTFTNISNDFGQTWVTGDPGRGVSPMADPFPVRANGARFDVPVGNALGLMARVGAGWSYYGFDTIRARTQRWRVSLQRQLEANTVVDVAYVGSWADRLPIAGFAGHALPGQYWATGQTRNDALANNLNANLPNPFLLSNFDSLRATHPLVYQQMSTLAFFTSPTIRRNQLLRPFPHMNGLVPTSINKGVGKTRSMEVSLERRFSRGFSGNIAYTALKGEEKFLTLNEFEMPTAYMPTQNGRPHRFTLAGIVELPFGRGRRYLNQGVLNHVLGGWQIASTYEWQPGQLIEFPNLFYTGSLDDIAVAGPTLDRWFNIDNFEKTPARTPAAFHSRVFPLRIEGVRAQSTNLLSANLSRRFTLTESMNLEVRTDVMNLANRSQFQSPNSTPTSTNFGKITGAVGESINRLVQLQARFRF